MYWLVTTAKVLALLAAPTFALSWARPLVARAWLLSLLPHALSRDSYGTVLAVGWTLVFEMAFYILFTIVLATRLPRLRTLAPVLIALAFAWTIPFVARHGTLHFYASTMQLEFLFGMLLAASIPWVRKIPASLAALLAAAGFCPAAALEPSRRRCLGRSALGHSRARRCHCCRSTRVTARPSHAKMAARNRRRLLLHLPHPRLCSSSRLHVLRALWRPRTIHSSACVDRRPSSSPPSPAISPTASSSAP